MNQDGVQSVCIIEIGGSKDDWPQRANEKALSKKIAQRSWNIIKLFAPRWQFILMITFTPIVLIGMGCVDDVKIRCGLCVALMGVYWLAELLPLAITALMPIALFPIFGIMSGKDIANEYINDTNFLFIGGLMVAIAVEKWNLHKRMAMNVIGLIGFRPKRLMLGLMLATASLSMFISNTAATSMMLPITLSLHTELTSALRREESGVCSSSPRRSAIDGSDPRKLGAQDDKWISDLLKGFLLSICFGANIGGTATLTGTPPNLLVIGQLSAIYGDQDIGLSYLKWVLFALPLAIPCLLSCSLILGLIFLRKVPARRNMRKVLERNQTCLPPMSFAEKLVLFNFIVLIFLWIFRKPEIIPGLSELFPNGYYTDATSSIIIVLILFATPSDLPNFFRRSRRKKREPERNIERILEWKDIREHFPWDVILLLGGGFGLSAGVKSSGLTTYLATSLNSLSGLPLPILQYIFIITTMLITNVCSNTATASVLIPISASFANSINVHPFNLILPVTLSCSLAFVLPVGTPPNAIVFSGNALSVGDMVTSGAKISFILSLIMLIYFMFAVPVILPVDQVPHWAIRNISSAI